MFKQLIRVLKCNKESGFQQSYFNLCVTLYFFEQFCELRNNHELLHNI